LAAIMADVDEEERMRVLKERIAELEATRQLEEAADDDDEEVDDTEENEAETEDNITAEAEAACGADDDNYSDTVGEITEELAANAQVDAGSENTEDDDNDGLQFMAVPSSPPPQQGDDEAEKSSTSLEEATTSAQEAVNSQKSNREKEFEELRKLAAARKSEEGGEMNAFERMKLKKQQELDALRARGGVNAVNKSRFDTGQALTTDMTAFGRNQRLAAEEERKKRLEASESLKKNNALGVNSWERNQLLDKDEARRRQMEAMEVLHNYRKGWDPTKVSESPEKKRFDAALEAEEDTADYVMPESENKKPIEEDDEPKPVGRLSLRPAKEDSTKSNGHGLKAPTYSRVGPPTYSRVDIKFSFGLVVKNGTMDESLRDSETLRKCMNGTREILTEELPPPPDKDKMKANFTMSSKMKFPQAYYDPTLEPTVISIEEDTSKKPAKGKNNTRTLCKASFPVFIRDEDTNDDGKNRAALALKETKATVFKALRAAVSGGKFLK